jgi:hypothetical protein
MPWIAQAHSLVSVLLSNQKECNYHRAVYFVLIFWNKWINFVKDMPIPPCRSESEKRKKGPAGTTGVPTVLRQAYFGSRDSFFFAVARNQTAVYSGRHGGLIPWWEPWDTHASRVPAYFQSHVISLHMANDSNICVSREGVHISGFRCQ